MSKLPTPQDKCVVLCHPEHAEKLLDSRGCDHRTELIGSEDTLWMGPIYQLSQEEEKIFVQYLDKIINDGKIHASSSAVGSPLLFVPKPNGQGLRLCVDYRHHNDHTMNSEILLPIMEALQRRLHKATHITTIYMKAGFHPI